MNCPVCNKKDTKVLDSRLWGSPRLPNGKADGEAGGGFSIRRRRMCQKCKSRFTTLESLEILDLTVIKRDGRREAYSKDKIIKGLRTALEKRSFLEEDFQKLIGEIERDIQSQADGEITSQALGEIVITRLKGFDPVAYIRYASVYRSFKDAQTFQKELKNLLKKKTKK